MATYRLYATCDHCDKRHPLPFGFCLEQMIVNEGSLTDIFRNRRPPKSIIEIMKNQTKCPNTGNKLNQTNPSTIFIVPTGNGREE